MSLLFEEFKPFVSFKSSRGITPTLMGSWDWNLERKKNWGRLTLTHAW